MVAGENVGKDSEGGGEETGVRTLSVPIRLSRSQFLSILRLIHSLRGFLDIICTGHVYCYSAI